MHTCEIFITLLTRFFKIQESIIQQQPFLIEMPKAKAVTLFEFPEGWLLNDSILFERKGAYF